MQVNTHMSLVICVCMCVCVCAIHLSCLSLSARNFALEYELERAYELNMKRVVQVGDKNPVK